MSTDQQSPADAQAILGSPPGIPVSVYTEQELFLKEAETLIQEINKINERMAGIPRARPARPKELRLELYKQLYDERKAKILRVEEINKVCLEKGYITE